MICHFIRLYLVPLPPYLEIEDVEPELCKELAILSELFSFVTFWDLAVLGERGKGLLGVSVSWLGAL